MRARLCHLETLLPSLFFAATLLFGAAVGAQPEDGDDGPPPVAGDAMGGLEPSLAVLELYVGDTYYEKTPEYVSRIQDEIGQLGDFSLLERADAERQIRAVMTTSTRRVTDEKLKEIERLMKQGDELLYTKPQQAVDILAKAKSELKAIMESLTLNEKVRQDYFKTQMMLARSHYDNNNTDKAGAILEDVIRVFGDEVKVTDDEYHPNIVALYRETYRRLADEPKGSITVRTSPPGATIYINGRKAEQQTPATVDSLYPGQVSVQAVKDGLESMIHKVDIVAGEQAELSIEIDYETALSFNDARFGLTFLDRAGLKEKAGTFAKRIGELLSVDKVLVTGLVDIAGRTHLEGYLIDVATGTIDRSESLFTKPNVVSNNRVTQLSMAVSRKGYVVETVYKPWYTNYIGWTGVGVGVIGLTLGAIFWADYESKLSEVLCPSEGGTNCKNFTERSALAGDAKSSRTIGGLGFAIAGVGFAGGILAFILMKEEDPDANTALELPDAPKLQLVSPTLMPDGSAGVSAAFTF